MSAQDVLRQLRALGAQIECQDGRLKLRAGKRAVPERLVEQARTVKSELILLLDNPELQKQRPSPTRGEGGTLREETPSKAAESLVFAEECQVASFGGILRRESGILRRKNREECHRRVPSGILRRTPAFVRVSGT